MFTESLTPGPELENGLGHQEPFPPPMLNGRCQFSYPTSAGASGNGKDAPTADTFRVAT